MALVHGPAHSLFCLLPGRPASLATAAVSNPKHAAFAFRKHSAAARRPLSVATNAGAVSLSTARPDLVEQIHPELNEGLDIDRLALTKKVWWDCEINVRAQA
ncbi:hypothetical protein WJX73_001250 [Symbiochloris irregularis]|uniref:Uncharacterized protein n=1 Tax=Symbiochloris irregularis TaxID=706552 RepID=A0AAW1P0J9_9CHLO